MAYMFILVIILLNSYCHSQGGDPDYLNYDDDSERGGHFPDYTTRSTLRGNPDYLDYVDDNEIGGQFNQPYENPCDSNPCQDNGTCHDFNVVDYNCSCKPGYYQVTRQICIEGNRCELERDLCGTFQCIPKNGSFICICGSEFTGDRCNIPINKKIVPEFFFISKNNALISGGGLITIEGRNVDVYPPLDIFLSSYHLTLSAEILEFNNTHLTFKVPRAPQKSYLGETFSVHVVYFRNTLFIGGDDYINTTLNFTYVDNPLLDQLYPRNISAEGGITLFAHGKGFSGATNITLFLHIMITDYSDRLDYENDFRELCTILNDTTMSCIFPNIRLRDVIDSISIPSFFSFSDELSFGLTYNGDHPIIRQEADGFKLYGFLGFRIDDYQHYRRLGLAAPAIKVNLVLSKPSFLADLENLKIIQVPEHLQIQGENVDVGCSIVDYVVHLGSSECRVSSLSSNLLQCQPPSQKPPSTNLTGPLNHCYKWPRSMPINIHLGRNTASYFIGCADYKEEWNFLLIVGAAAAGFFLVVIVAGIVGCCCCCKKKNNNNFQTVKFDKKSSDYSRTIEDDYKQDGGFKSSNLIGSENSKRPMGEKNNNYMKSIGEDENSPYSSNLIGSENSNRPMGEKNNNYMTSIGKDEDMNEPMNEFGNSYKPMRIA